MWICIQFDTVERQKHTCLCFWHCVLRTPQNEHSMEERHVIAVCHGCYVDFFSATRKRYRDNVNIYILTISRGSQKPKPRLGMISYCINYGRRGDQVRDQELEERGGSYSRGERPGSRSLHGELFLMQSRFSQAYCLMRQPILINVRFLSKVTLIVAMGNSMTYGTRNTLLLLGKWIQTVPMDVTWKDNSTSKAS